MAGDFDPSKHPRDHGKFSSGPGAEGGEKKPGKGAAQAAAKQRAMGAAQHMAASAHEASAKATRTGSSTDHEAAAKLHTEAATTMRRLGSETGAKIHDAMAAHHQESARSGSQIGYTKEAAIQASAAAVKASENAYDAKEGAALHKANAAAAQAHSDAAMAHRAVGNKDAAQEHQAAADRHGHQDARWRPGPMISDQTRPEVPKQPLPKPQPQSNAARKATADAQKARNKMAEIHRSLEDPNAAPGRGMKPLRKDADPKDLAKLRDAHLAEAAAHDKAAEQHRSGGADWEAKYHENAAKHSREDAAKVPIGQAPTSGVDIIKPRSRGGAGAARTPIAAATAKQVAQKASTPQDSGRQSTNHGDEHLAEIIHKTVESIPDHQKWGSSVTGQKAFISDVYNHMPAGDQAKFGSMNDFKQKLHDLNRDGHVVIKRADSQGDIEEAHPGKLAASEAKHSMGMTSHFIEQREKRRR